MIKLLLSAVALAWTVIFVTFTTDSALADRRVALVIGNSSYKNAALNLPNPKNDALDVATMLRTLDFEVVQATDANKRDLEMAMQNFARAAVDADSALFFYAGHAMQYQGRNYLMPVDAELEDEFSLRYQMIPIDDVRAALDRVNGVKIMILDACRNNPLAERLARQSAGFTRAIGATRGLARIDKTQGMVVAYATAADDVAADGNGRNSPFTSALLKRLKEPGLEIEPMFRAIARDVYNQTGGRQRPETYISLLSEYYLNQSDRLAWEKVKDSGDVAALRDFIARFPSSIRALDARYRLEMLERFARDRELEKQRFEREMQVQREAQERNRIAAADRQRQEREAAEKQAAEEAARAAEADRLRKERLAAEQKLAEEQARLAEAEKQRKARELEEKARLAAAERERREREVADRLEAEARAKLAADERVRQERLAAERQEAEQRAKLAAEDKARKEREAAEKRETEQRAKVAAAEKARQEREVAERKQAELRAKQAEADRVRREQEAAMRRKAEELAKLAEAERLRKEREANDLREQQERTRLAAADKSKMDVACKREDERLALLQAAGSGAREELIRFERELSCERLRPVALASLGNMTAAPAAPATPPAAPANTPTANNPSPVNPQAPAQPATAQPATPLPEARPVNTIELVMAAQTELRRLGCFSGRADGKLSRGTTGAIKKYLSEREITGDPGNITEALLRDMKDQGERVCPLECDRGEVPEGNRCVAAPRKKSAPVAIAPREERRKAARPEREMRPARVAAEPVARQPAPSSGSRPAAKVLGVGF